MLCLTVPGKLLVALSGNEGCDWTSLERLWTWMSHRVVQGGRGVKGPGLGLLSRTEASTELKEQKAWG